jgi:Ca2+-binding RTX toxin-like protein
VRKYPYVTLPPDQPFWQWKHQGMARFIELNSGATEVDIQRALNTLRSEGGTLKLPEDADIVLTKSLSLMVGNADVTIDLNGSTIHQAGNSTAFGVMGQPSAPTQVQLGADAGGNATITYGTLPTGITVGSTIKIIADDALPHDHIDPGDKGQPTRMGQALEVVAIEGNKVIFGEPLIEAENYQTNVRASTYPTGQVTIKNGTFEGNVSDYMAGGGGDLLHIRSVVDPVVENVTVKDSLTGVKFVDTVGASASDVVGTNLWAAIQSSAANGTSIDGLFAEHVAHGVLVHGTGNAANSSAAASYGADIGLVAKNSVVYDSSKAAYDFHSESRYGAYIDSLAFDSRMFGDLRGVGNSFIDSAGAGNQYGIQFFEYGDGDGRDSLVSNLVLREIGNYAFIVSGKPLNNTVVNSSFESAGKGYAVPVDWISFDNTTVTENVLLINDLMTGTSGHDKLLGGKGSDVISGGGGGDLIWGGEGVDILIGGAGSDRFMYNAISEGNDVIVDFHGGPGGDVLDLSVLAIREGWDRENIDAHVRYVQRGLNTLVQVLDGDAWTTLATLLKVSASSLTSDNLRLYLSSSNDVGEVSLQAAMRSIPVQPLSMLRGTANSDNMHADMAAGSAINGGAGNDNIVGHGSDDYILGEAGDDIIVAGGGDDVVYGGTGNDRIYGGDGDDFLLGEDGNDVINGGAGADTIDGGNGNDKLYGDAGDDRIWGGAGDDFLFGGAGNDRLYGGDGNDTLYGDAGDDILFGGAGNDVLFGGEGNDFIDGGAGDDTLHGGKGNDVFVFSQGRDLIRDFTIGEDKISLSDSGLDNFADVLAHAVQRGANVVITEDGNTLTIAGVRLADLSGDDFLF